MKNQPGIVFRGKHNQPAGYPAWRYHDHQEPRLVVDTQQDEQASRDGYGAPGGPSMFQPTRFHNFHLDFEEMSPRQLVLFARDKYDLDLWPKLRKDKMIRAIWSLFMHSRDAAERMVLLAQSVEMDLDATQVEIKRAVAGEVTVHEEVFFV